MKSRINELILNEYKTYANRLHDKIGERLNGSDEHKKHNWFSTCLAKEEEIKDMYKHEQSKTQG